jgi:peptidoglycan/LPS O-acetylase OafA/YrhL
MMGGATRPRSAPLDALRAVAALLVFAWHITRVEVFGVHLGLDNAITIFFVLSGYLVYRPFLAGVDLRAYAVRRVARIVPAYWVALIGCGAILGMTPQPDELAFLTVRVINVGWTLQLEVGFYLLLPLIAVAVAGSPGRIVAMAAASILGTVALLGVLVGTGHAVDGHALRTLPSMLWAFAPGMVVAAQEFRGVFVPRRWWPLGVGLICAGFAANLPFCDVLTAIGAGILVGIAIQIRAMPLARLAIAGGALSYSVYLWHLPLVQAVGWWAVPATLAIASVVYLVVERPFMSLARRSRWVRPTLATAAP